MTRRILITGGAGFIGSHFVHHWRQHHPQDKLIILDALTYAADKNNLNGLKEHEDYQLIQGNICNQTLVERIFQQQNINMVAHFAAESHVDRSIDSPDIFIETNIIGTHVLLKAALHFKVDLFLQISTDEVYGSLQVNDPAFTEQSPMQPNSPYAASKAGADCMARAYYKTFNLPVITTHCSNNYGPYQDNEKLIPKLICNTLQGVALPIYGKGDNIRDWIFAKDHCRALETIITQGTFGETYNIGGECEYTNTETVNMICQLIDELFQQQPNLKQLFPNCPAAKQQSCNSLMQFVTDRPGHDKRYAIANEKIKREFNFELSTDFKHGLLQTIQWFISQIQAEQKQVTAAAE